MLDGYVRAELVPVPPSDSWLALAARVREYEEHLAGRVGRIAAARDPTVVELHRILAKGLALESPGYTVLTRP